MRRVVGVQLVVVSCAVLLASACGAPSNDETPAPGNVGAISQGLIFEQSLAITDMDTLKPFTLERVLGQIIQTSGVSGVTPVSLFNQWWDTQNPGPSLGRGPHCDDELTNGLPSLNGYPWECPRGEGYQAFINPFPVLGRGDALYWPIGLFNRFDLAPADGSHCGEYRIAFAMKPGHRLARGQNFLIFEAVLPNPRPEEGIRGCYDVAKFWYSLSHEPNPDVRREMLVKFYFHGWGEFAPVVHVDHYGTRLGADGYGCSTGQIRTNQFVDGDWNLREFRMVKDCRCDRCGLIVAPTTTKDNPSGESFHGGSTEPRAGDLQNLVINSVGSLGSGGVNDISWVVPNKLNTGESVSVFGGPTDYLHHFMVGANTHPQFKSDLHQQVMAMFGGALDSHDIVNRAATQSCAGCHELSNGVALDQNANVVWPFSLRFFHVGDFPINGSFPLSDAMHQEFLPRRAELLMKYLESGGESAPTEGRCKIEIPDELHVNCEEERERDPNPPEEGPKKFIRPFKAIGLEKLKPRLLPSIGGSRTH